MQRAEGPIRASLRTVTMAQARALTGRATAQHDCDNWPTSAPLTAENYR